MHMCNKEVELVWLSSILHQNLYFDVGDMVFNGLSSSLEKHDNVNLQPRES